MLHTFFNLYCLLLTTSNYDNHFCHRLESNLLSYQMRRMRMYVTRFGSQNYIYFFLPNEFDEGETEQEGERELYVFEIFEKVL
jgi:hypothetical protein